ncbi:MAG: hypothetical protein AABZ74_08890 [Cyanobacteriota bacterium]
MGKKYVVFFVLICNFLNSNMAFSKEEEKNEKAIDIKVKTKVKIKEIYKDPEQIPESNFTDKELIDLINEAKNYLDKDECEKVILTLSQINQESEVNKVKNTFLLASFLGLVMENSMKNTEEDNIKGLKLARYYANLLEDEKIKSKSLDSIDELLKYGNAIKVIFLMKDKKFKEAEIETNRLIKKEPDNGYLYDLLGTIKFNLGQKEAGKKLLDKSISMSSDKSTGYYDLACLYGIENNKLKAIENLKKAIKVDIKLKERAKKDKDFNNIKKSKEFIEVTT